jgi:hypothetical protein
VSPAVVAEQLDSGPNVPPAHFYSAQDSVLSSTKLITIELNVEGISKSFRALVDTGASNNFVRAQTLLEHSLAPTPSGLTTPSLIVRLANGTIVKVPKRTISLNLSFTGFKGKDKFIILDLDERFDLILGMPWLTRYSPRIDWSLQSLSFPHLSDEFAPTSVVEEQVYCTGVSLVEENTSASVEATSDPVCDGPVASDASLLQQKPIPVSNRFSILDDEPNATSFDSSPNAVDVCFPLPFDVNNISTDCKQSQSLNETCSCSKPQLPTPVSSLSPDQAPTFETINAVVQGTNGTTI